MQADVFAQDVCYLKGVGPNRAALLQKLGIETVGDLIEAYPRDYQDWSHPVSITAAPIDEPCCVRATVIAPAEERLLSGGRRLYTVLATDGQVNLRLTFFNARYTAAQLQRGRDYLFYGKLGAGFTLREMVAPQFAPAQTPPALHPVYPLTAGLSNKVMTGLVKNALARCDRPLADPLPDAVRRQYGLCELDRAVETIHFPPTAQAAQEARRRLIFDELLTLQLGLARLKNRSRGVTDVVITRDRTPDFFARLPFAPTGAQRRVIREALTDMQSGVPMNRLVQGDVGSGKTAVAAALCHTVALNGWQCAVMAPTEILATQHYETFSRLFAGTGLRVALLTGSQTKKQKQAVLADLAAGAVHVVVGTHALLQETVRFYALGLVVTDEQHRFGVGQRAALLKKGSAPHMLVMSATPIPRTLAHIIYGDLDLSVIDELPPGRQTVATYAVDSSYHERVYAFIRKHVAAGRQAYIVCPLVEEGDEPSDLTAATQYAETLQTEAFPNCRVALLHGKMPAAQKEQVMGAFAAGQIDILVATTVIEVGVDVPNAVLMVVENAERFGLSQLHQLRGRVGRGQYPSTCILISDHQGETNRKRLNVLCQTADGFRIADEDLKLRGPGDFFGARQHGLPRLKLADLLTDTETLRQTARAAADLLQTDPTLSRPEHAGLAAAVKRMLHRAYTA